jgi:hypothetical protein
MFSLPFHTSPTFSKKCHENNLEFLTFKNTTEVQMGSTEIHVTSSQSSVVFFQFCDVVQVAIIHKNIYTNLVTFKI